MHHDNLAEKTSLQESSASKLAKSNIILEDAFDVIQ